MDRKERIEIRLTEEEKNLIVEAAKKEKITVSKFIREYLLSKARVALVINRNNDMA